MSELLRHHTPTEFIPDDEPLDTEVIEGRKAFVPVWHNWQKWIRGERPEFVAYFVLVGGIHNVEYELFVENLGLVTDPKDETKVLADGGEGPVLFVTCQQDHTMPGEIYAVAFSSYPDPAPFQQPIAAARA